MKQKLYLNPLKLYPCFSHAKYVLFFLLFVLSVGGSMTFLKDSTITHLAPPGLQTAPSIRLEVEDYVNAFDTTSGNEGGEYRAGDVDMGFSGDIGDGYAVGWTQAGEWLSYEVDIPITGQYDLTLRLASGIPGNKVVTLAINNHAIRDRRH